MPFTDQLNIVEICGIYFCTIGKRQYKLTSNPNDVKNIILFPVSSMQDEILKQKAKTRIERSVRRVNPFRLNYEPLYAAIERETFNNNQTPSI